MDARGALRPPLLDNGTSAAQRCPEDVLLELMNHLVKADVAKCSLVCRGWLDACRVRLYTMVAFLGTTSDPLLSRTLCTSPHLIGLIRRVVLFPRLRYGGAYRWIPTLVSSRAYSFELMQIQPIGALLSIFGSTPPFQSIKHVTLRGDTMRHNEMSIRQVLEMFPNADSFVLSLHPGFCHFSPPARGPHDIRRISVRAHCVPVNAFVHFLETYAPSLTRLDIEAPLTQPDFDTMVPPEEKEKTLVHALLSMTHLVSLTIHIRDSPSPFLDHVVPQLPNLRELYCAHGSYSSTLLQELPGQIRTLRLYAYHETDFDVTAIEAMIWRSRMCKTSLRKLYVHTIGQPPKNMGGVEAACAASGVHFSDCSWFDFMELVVWPLLVRH